MEISGGAGYKKGEALRTDHSIADALQSALKDATQNPSKSNRASRIWYEVNGNDEERHTVGVFLKEDEGGNTLFVYIDTMAKLQDYNANKLIYLARLEGSGLDIVDIQFKISKYKKNKHEVYSQNTTARATEQAELVQMPPADPDKLKQLVKQIDIDSPALRSAVSKAAESVMRRQRAEETEDYKNTP